MRNYNCNYFFFFLFSFWNCYLLNVWYSGQSPQFSVFPPFSHFCFLKYFFHFIFKSIIRINFVLAILFLIFLRALILFYFTTSCFYFFRWNICSFLTYLRILMIAYLIISSHPCLTFIFFKLLGVFVRIFYAEDFPKMSDYHMPCSGTYPITIKKLLNLDLR